MKMSDYQLLTTLLASAIRDTPDYPTLGLPYLQIQKRGHFGKRGGGGVSYFTNEFFFVQWRTINKI